jgi:rod shape-determining protein MreB
MTEHDQDSSQDPAAQDQGVLYVGIDLGTSRTAVSASNGVRDGIASHVGYPKDVVSRKLLKKDVLFGDDAQDHRLSLSFFTPLSKGVLRCSEDGEDAEGNLRAAKDLVREVVRLARPRKDELVYAVIGVPSEASFKNKDAIIEAARESVDSVMLCSEPFAVAYGQDMLDDVLVIDIGAGTVDLCRMHGTMPEETDQVTLETAGNFVDESLAALIREKHPEAQFSMRMVKGFKERFSSVAEQMEPAVVEMPVNGKPTEFDITDLVRQACRGMVGPIVDGLHRLIATFDPEFQHRLRNRVLLAGGGSLIKGLDTAIEKEMKERLGGGKVIHVEEPVYGGAEGALKIAHDMPEDFWQQLR